jgi:hypothetical protein
MDNHLEYDDCIVIDDPWSGSSIDSYQQNFKTIDPEYLNKHKVHPDNILILDPTIGLECNHFSKLHKIVERWSGVSKEDQDERDARRDALLRAMIW